MALLREKVYVVEIYRDLFKCAAEPLSPHFKYQICLTNPGPYKYTHTKDVQLCLPHSFHFQLFSLLFHFSSRGQTTTAPPPHHQTRYFQLHYTGIHDNTFEYSSNFTPIESSESIRLDIDIRVKTIQIGKPPLLHSAILPFSTSPLLILCHRA